MTEKLNQEALETCRFCGTFPNNDEKSCLSKDAALDCVWLDSVDRKRLTVGPAPPGDAVHPDASFLTSPSPEHLRRLLAERTRERDAIVQDLRSALHREIEQRKALDAAEARVKALTAAMKNTDVALTDAIMRTRSIEDAENWTYVRDAARAASSDAAPESKEGE